MPRSAQDFPTKEAIHEDKGNNLDVYQCSGCGLVQLNSQPVPYYKDVIRTAAYSPEMKKFRIQQFDNFLAKCNLKGKKILEVGCGKGEYLKLIKQCDADVYGVEHLSESVDVCMKDGLSVTKGFIGGIDPFKHPSYPLDGFFILNFLEHIPSINSTLKGIASNLTEDGIGLVEVPNFDMILKKNLFSEFIADHLFYFTKDTLVRALEFNGFDVLECNSIWYDYILSAIVKKRKKLDVSNFHKVQEKIKADINKYVDDNIRVAVWGAGHQALAVISLTKIEKKIKYVIDSAVFKQGFYTPSSHLKIVPPSRLDRGDISAIIVMAASYSDEVANIIKHKYPEMKFAILREDKLELVK